MLLDGVNHVALITEDTERFVQDDHSAPRHADTEGRRVPLLHPARAQVTDVRHPLGEHPGFFRRSVAQLHQSSTAAVIAFWKRSKFQRNSQFSVMRVTTSK